MIKYLGSKRRLVAGARRDPGDLRRPHAPSTCSRARPAWPRPGAAAGVTVTAVDSARYADVLARTYVATELTAGAAGASSTHALADLTAVPPAAGYVTDIFCRAARYFQPDNGARIDAMRDAIADRYAGTWLEPVLLTALLEAADRVDSTTGVQMAYLKQWAPRAHRPLRAAGAGDPRRAGGTALRADAARAVRHARAGRPRLPRPAVQPAPVHGQLPRVGDDRGLGRARPLRGGVQAGRPTGAATRAAPSTSGAACPPRSRRASSVVDAGVVVVSYNDESWVSLDELVEMCAARGPVTVLAFDSRRYVGATIGIHSPARRQGRPVSHVRNTEYVLVAGDLSPGRRRRLRALGPSAVPVPAPARRS